MAISLIGTMASIWVILQGVVRRPSFPLHVAFNRS